jgi:hypothetical protein
VAGAEGESSVAASDKPEAGIPHPPVTWGVAGKYFIPMAQEIAATRYLFHFIVDMNPFILFCYR